MITWIVIAVRNLFRNPRRSLFTLASVALGFSAVNVFGGFTKYVFTSLGDGFIYAEGSGHLTIFKKGFLTEGHFDPGKYLLTAEDAAAVRRVCADDPRIVLVSPKLLLHCMLNSGKASTIAIAMGAVPADVTAIRKSARGSLARQKFLDGHALEDVPGNPVGLSTGLARMLKLEIGSEAMLTAATIDGQMNALDVRVAHTFNTGMEVLNDKLLACPTSLAQSLFDTTGVDRIGVLLADTSETEAVRQHLEQVLSGRGIEIKSYADLSPLYGRAKQMFNVIFAFVFAIVMSIVLVSVVNTTSMAVMERTQEIGTLRSLGLKQCGIVRLFAMESAALGVAGSLLGAAITFLAWWAMQIAAPTWVPPAMAVQLPIEVWLVPNYLVCSFSCLVALTTVAAVFPARRAAAQNIVESLGHV